MREEPLVLGLRHALLFGCTVDFLSRLHEAESAGRLRDTDGNGDGHVVAGRAGAAGFGLPDGAGHVYAPLTAVRHAALGLDDADVGRCGQLHAADLGDGVLAAALFSVDVLAVLWVCHVELHLVHDDALQVAHDLHGGDGDEDIELVRGYSLSWTMVPVMLLFMVVSFLDTRPSPCYTDRSFISQGPFPLQRGGSFPSLGSSPREAYR